MSKQRLILDRIENSPQTESLQNFRPTGIQFYFRKSVNDFQFGPNSLIHSIWQPYIGPLQPSTNWRKSAREDMRGIAQRNPLHTLS